MSVEDCLRNTGVRREIAVQTISLLKADSRVETVTWGGSLGEGGGDAYSDVDVTVSLASGVSDRLFADEVPSLLTPMGTRLTDAWGVRTLPDKYVRNLYFVAYPLFWHVDIGVLGGDHADGSDLQNAYHWPRFFKTWVETLKGTLRGKHTDRPDYIESVLGRWLDLPPHDPATPTAQRLADYLDVCAERTRVARLAPPRIISAAPPPDSAAIENLYQHCAALRREYLL